MQEIRQRKSSQPCLIALAPIALALGLCGWATAAAASTITYAWTGTVTDITPGSQPLVTLGQKIGITLSLDGSVPDLDPDPQSGLYSGDTDPQVGPPQPPLVLAVNIGGVTTIGPSQFARVRAGDQGVDEFEVQTVQVHVGLFFDIHFLSSNPGVLTSGALPQVIDPRDFELARFIVNDLSAVPPDPSIPRFGGTIDDLAVAPTPLPGSLGLFAPALLGLLGLGGWKRRLALK